MGSFHKFLARHFIYPFSKEKLCLSNKKFRSINISMISLLVFLLTFSVGYIQFQKKLGIKLQVKNALGMINSLFYIGEKVSSSEYSRRTGYKFLVSCLSLKETTFRENEGCDTAAIELSAR